MKAKQKCEAIIRKARDRKYQVILGRVDKNMCSLHPEWADLTKEEQGKINRWEVYAHKCYKNIAGGGYSERYVSDILYQTKILPRLNKNNYTKTGKLHGAGMFEDKNYQDMLIGIRYPDIVMRNIAGEFYDTDFQHISKSGAMDLCSRYPVLVFKESIGTGHGKGVHFAGKEEYSALIEHLKENYIVQQVMKQHDSLGYYNSSSVNIIRITSLFWKSTVYILGGILRVGVPGNFCDHTSLNGQHPLVIPVNGDGSLGKTAIDCDNGYVYEDVRGKEITGSVFRFQEMKEIVKKEHEKYPYHGIIGWDLTLDEGGNIRCMEYNSECPGIVQSQFALGPIFSQRTPRGNRLLDEILRE